MRTDGICVTSRWTAGTVAVVVVYPVWLVIGTMSPLVSKLKVTAVVAAGFAPMLEVQVRTTALFPAQASASCAVRIVFVPLTVRVLTTLAVPSQVEVQAVAATSVAQIAVEAVSLIVPSAAMEFWVVKLSTMLPAVEAAKVSLLAALVQIA